MSSELAPAVLLGSGVPAVDISRSLGRRGIEVITVERRPSWAERSRYITRAFHPASQDDEALLELLSRLARGRSERPLLLPLHDDYTLFVSRHRAALTPAYRLLAPDAELVDALVSKRGLGSVCRAGGVATPATYYPATDGEVDALARRLAYPCIVKPNFSRDWVRSRPAMLAEAHKVIEIESPEQLLAVGAALSNGHGDIVIQEIVPGPEANLYYLAAYLDRNSNPLGAFVGRKLRTCPPHFGNGTYVESVHAPEVVRLGVGLLQRIGFTGCGGVEFKLDARDGAYKLIEINARFGMWDGFAAKCGLDLAYLAYADTMGLPLPPHDSYRAGMRWVEPDRDFWTMLDYHRAGELSFVAWLRSLIRCQVFAPAALDDPAPWVALNFEFARGVLQAARRRLVR